MQQVNNGDFMDLDEVQNIVNEVGASYFPIKLVQEITDACNRNNLSKDEYLK